MADGPYNPHNDDRPGREGMAQSLSQEELLSAYLDGECTADEQSEVEARMAVDPDLRQLAEELRAVRASLELLPQYRLPVNFAETVQRRAEREVLTGNGDTSSASASGSGANAAATDAVRSIEVISRGDTTGWARPYLWSLAALAAALLILVTNRNPEERTSPIARGPEPAGAAAAKIDEFHEQSNGRKEAPDTTLDDRLPAKKTGAEDFDSKALREARSSQDVNLAIAGEPPTSEGLEAGGAPPASPGAAPEQAPPPNLTATRNGAITAPGIETTGNLAAGPQDRPVADVYEALGVPRLQKQINRFNNGRSDYAATPSGGGAATFGAQLKSELAPAAAAEAEPKAAGFAGGGAATANATSSASNAVVSGAQQGVAQHYFYDNTAAEPLRVVEVLVARDAWQRGEVANVFAKNSIALFDNSGKAPVAGDSTQADWLEQKEKDRAKLEIAKQEPAKSERSAPLSNRATDFELMVICAPSAQVQAALGDFQEQQDHFQVVNVTDASAPEQLFDQLARNRLGNEQQAPAIFAPETSSESSLGGGAQPDATAERKSLAKDDSGDKKVDGIAQTKDKLSTNDKEARLPAGPKTVAAEPARQAGATGEEQAAPTPVARKAQARGFNVAEEGQGQPPSGGLGGGLGRATTQQAGGGYGGAGGRAELNRGRTPQDQRRGGYGYQDNTSRAGLAVASDLNGDVPLGYAQRVTLQPPTVTANNKLVESNVAQNRAYSNSLDQKAALAAAAAARERALFFFRVVDERMLTGVNKTGAAPSDAAAAPVQPKAGGKDNATETATPRVPAPAPVGSR
jgi:hypothetical protein